MIDTSVETRALRRLREEIDTALWLIVETETESLQQLGDAVVRARRVFVLGAGRSGLALRMVAMRLMHFGLDVHVVGDTTTPAIAAGDLLLAASGSGTTPGIVRAAITAREAGAQVATLTASPDSELAAMSDVVVTIPAAGKLDRSGAASQQYAGSLFEQSVLLVGDSLFHSLWKRSGTSADELWTRHANLE